MEKLLEFKYKFYYFRVNIDNLNLVGEFVHKFRQFLYKTILKNLQYK